MRCMQESGGILIGDAEWSEIVAAVRNIRHSRSFPVITDFFRQGENSFAIALRWENNVAYIRTFKERVHFITSEGLQEVRDKIFTRAYTDVLFPDSLDEKVDACAARVGRTVTCKMEQFLSE